MNNQPSSIGSINLLPEEEKRKIYTRYIPPELTARFNLPDVDSLRIQSYLQFKFSPGSSDMEMSLFHEQHFHDPVLFTHLTDTLNGQVHILLYILNDPDSPRYDVDKLPDGTSTQFGILQRNVQAEEEALKAGLAPGQIHRGLRMLGEAILAFEKFIQSLGQDVYFAEPLHYHNAVIFERYGFSYQNGKRLMDEIQSGFQKNGKLTKLLNPDNPFRTKGTDRSIRLRSWAIHDGILGEPFTNVTMYKHIGKMAKLLTAEDCEW
jgi:hypothetical protein